MVGGVIFQQFPVVLWLQKFVQQIFGAVQSWASVELIAVFVIFAKKRGARGRERVNMPKTMQLFVNKQTDRTPSIYYTSLNGSVHVTCTGVTTERDSSN